MRIARQLILNVMMLNNISRTVAHFAGHSALVFNPVKYPANLNIQAFDKGECPKNCVNARDTLKVRGYPLTKLDSKPV